MTDSEKLNALALWFDVQDRKTGNTDREVQQDLRLIATNLESLRSELEQAKQRIAELEKKKATIRQMKDERGVIIEVVNDNVYQAIELFEDGDVILTTKYGDSPSQVVELVDKSKQLENPERIKEIVFRFCDYFYHGDGKIWPTHEVGWNAWTQTPKGKKLLNL